MGFNDFGANEGEFNQGLAIIYRLDGIAKLLINSRLKKDYTEMYDALLSYFAELYSIEKNKKSLDNQREIQKEVEKKFYDWTSIYKNKKMIPRNCHPRYFLFDWELKIRQWGQKLGLGMAMKQDSRYAMAGK